jgi:hypothetical protein
MASIWLLLLGYFFLHWLILYSHYKFYSPLFFGIIEPWVNWFDQPDALGFFHYPGHFLILPYFSEWARFALAVPLEGTVLGSISVLFYGKYGGRRVFQGRSLRELLYPWSQVTIAWLIINGLLMGVKAWLPQVLSSALEDAPLRQMVFTYLFQPFLYTVIVSLFFFVISHVAVYRASFAESLSASAAIFRRRPLMCLFLAATVLALPVMLSLIVQNEASLVEWFFPEIIYWVLLARLAAEVIVFFLWMGTATRFLIDQDQAAIPI